MEMKRITGLVAAVLLGAPMGFAGAEVSGRITLKGTPPAEISIKMDPLCGRLHKAEVTTQHYVVSPEGGLRDVFVYIREIPGGKTYQAPADKVPLLDQVNCIYTPYVMGVMTDQKFKIRNSDPLMHNVHATPTVDGNRSFNIGQPVKGMEYTASFAKREVLLRIKCDVHPWMFAYIGVMEHPWFAVTDKDGVFKLPPDLPPGEYTLTAFHRRTGEQTQKITVADGEKKQVNFVMEVPR